MNKSVQGVLDSVLFNTLVHILQGQKAYKSQGSFKNPFLNHSRNGRIDLLNYTVNS